MTINDEITTVCHVCIAKKKFLSVYSHENYFIAHALLSHLNISQKCLFTSTNPGQCTHQESTEKVLMLERVPRLLMSTIGF